MRDDQHVIMFSSSRKSGFLTFERSAHLNLTACLRSSAENAKFANDWVQLANELVDERQVGYSHNFHGEEPDIHYVPEASSEHTDEVPPFVEKSVDIVRNFACKFKDLHFLPVLVFMPEEIVNKIMMVLEKTLTVQRGSYQTPNEKYGEATKSGHPTVRLLNFTETEGSEFAVAILLIYGQDYKERMFFIRDRFLTAITRATTKMAVVYGQRSDICSQDNLKKAVSAQMELVENHVEMEDLNTILVGRSYDEDPTFEIISDQEMASIKMPNIPGIQCLRVRRSGVRIFQIDDLFRKEDIKTIWCAKGRKKIRVTLVVIIGEIMSRTPQAYVHATKTILKSSQYSNHFEVIDLHFPFSVDIPLKVILDSFLQKTFTDRLTDFDDQLTNTGISANWENWKAKGNELYRLEKLDEAVEMYSKGTEALLRLNCPIETKWEEVFSFDIHSSRTWLAMLNTVYTGHSLRKRLGYKYTCERCIASAMFYAVKALKIYASELCITNAMFYAVQALKIISIWTQVNERMKEIENVLHRKYDSNQGQVESLENSRERIKKELQEQDTKRLRDKTFALSTDLVSGCLVKFHQQKEDYNKIDNKDIEKLLEHRKVIVKNLTSPAHLQEIKNKLNELPTDFDTLVEKLDKSVPYFIIAMMALEWNPYDSQAIENVFAFLDCFLESVNSSINI